jgi:hypothetical protein
VALGGPFALELVFGVGLADPTKGTTMDHSATHRRVYDLLNAGDIDGFGALLADGFVEHEEAPGLAPTKEGVCGSFACIVRRFPICGWTPRTFWLAVTRSLRV